MIFTDRLRCSLLPRLSQGSSGAGSSAPTRGGLESSFGVKTASDCFRILPKLPQKSGTKRRFSECVHQPLFLALVRHMASADERAPLATRATTTQPAVEVRERAGRVA